ncbi:MAG: zinc ribbon domain-containing protein [Planctomycetales bacterium]|nr:zinc ribbon domain-containing protein [Planctomycetales bacterium]
MPIQAVCDHCSKRYSLDDSFAGRTVKCRTCHQSFTVPGPVAGGDADATPVAGRSPRARGGGDDVLELKTEYAERASMPTITEPAGGGDGCPQCGTPNPPGTKRCGKCGKRLILPGSPGGKGGDDEGGARKSRYKRKSRWTLKLAILFLFLAGGAVAAGYFLAPRNMERKWEATKAFWGTSFLEYLSQLASFDMSLEGGAQPAKPEEPETPAAETPPVAAGPAEGAKVWVRGQVSAVEPGEAGGAPMKFALQGTGGKSYRIVLSEPSQRLEQIRTDLGAGKPGPWGEAVGTLGKHTLEGTLNQVAAESFLAVEASALEGKPTIEEIK